MNNKRKKNTGAWLALALALVPPARAASFDCEKAQTQVEQLICADSELSMMDEDLATRYKAVMSAQSQADALHQAQKEWIKVRNTCPDLRCLKDSYVQRLRDIQSPVLAPFQFFRDEELPEQRNTPVCKDFKNYLNHPRSNALFNSDGTLVRESSLFKSVRWESLDKERFRTAYMAHVELTRPKLYSEGAVVHELRRRFESSQWTLQRTLAYPFEFNPRPEQKQRWLFRLVNLQPYMRNMKDQPSKVELPTWFNFGDEAFLGYENASPLNRNDHDLRRKAVRQWMTYAGNTYAVINATYGDGKGATPAFLSLEIDRLNVEDTGASFMHFTCAFRAENTQ